MTIVAAGPTCKGGTVSIESGTYVRYTPPPGSNPNVPYQGPDSFTYKISDGNGGVATATVDINVTIVNNPPIAVDDSYQLARNSSNNRLAVLANDNFAPDIGESLTITQFTRPGNGEALQVIENGTVLQYSPPASFTGIQTLTYTVTDGRGSFATATVTIDVGNFNSSPIATNDSYSVTGRRCANPPAPACGRYS